MTMNNNHIVAAAELKKPCDEGEELLSATSEKHEKAEDAEEVVENDEEATQALKKGSD